MSLSTAARCFPGPTRVFERFPPAYTTGDSLCYFIYAYFNVNMLNVKYLLKIKKNEK